MTHSSHTKVFKQLERKPAILKKFIKHNEPKKRSCGFTNKKCVRCLRPRAHVNKYGLHLCRQCFRDIAVKIGFKQFN